MQTEILVGPERRRRWTMEEKVRIVDEAAEPGVRVADVARRHAISRQQLYQWRREVRHERGSRQRTEIVGFVPVEVPAAPPKARSSLPSGAGARIEIELRNGRVLRLSSVLPTAELRRLIRVTEQA